MTEPAKTTTGQQEENFFYKKLGPFPMWMYLVGVGGAILLYIYYKRKGSSSTSTTDTTGTTSTLPPFINQVYTNPVPPDNDKPPAKDNDKPKKVKIEVGNLTLAGLAKHYGMTLKELEQLNPALDKKYGKSPHKHIPKGTEVWVVG